MARKNGNAGGRRFDTRFSFNEMVRLLGLTPRQKIRMRRYLLQRDEKEVSIK